MGKMAAPKSKKVEFFVDQPSGGRITPRALLDPEGTISFGFYPELLESGTTGLVSRIAGYNWFFNIGYYNKRFIIERGGARLAVDLNWCKGKRLPREAFASWKVDALILSFGSHLSHWQYPQVSATSSIAAPPYPLIQWAQQRELKSVRSFSTEDEFCIRVHSALQRFEERLSPLLSRDCFWDLERDGNKIVGRRPKREIDIHDLLHAMLVDHMSLSNIEVIREVRSSSGAVDFLFLGIGPKGRKFKLCTEFKNAHSPDLIDGMAGQLRSYMRSQSVKNGAYVILDYRGIHFGLPSESNEKMIGLLHKADECTPNHQINPIKIHHIRLGQGS